MKVPFSLYSYLCEKSPAPRLPPNTYRNSPANVSVCRVNGGGRSVEFTARNDHCCSVCADDTLNSHNSSDKLPFSSFPPNITKPPPGMATAAAAWPYRLAGRKMCASSVNSSSNSDMSWCWLNVSLAVSTLELRFGDRWRRFKFFSADIDNKMVRKNVGSRFRPNSPSCWCKTASSSSLSTWAGKWRLRNEIPHSSSHWLLLNR